MQFQNLDLELANSNSPKPTPGNSIPAVQDDIMVTAVIEPKITTVDESVANISRNLQHHYHNHR